MSSGEFGSETYRKERDRRKRESVERTRSEYSELVAAIRVKSADPIEQGRMLAGHCFIFLFDHIDEYEGTEEAKAAQAVLYEAFPWLEEAVRAAERL